MKVTFPFSAGILVRRRALFQLEEAAKLRNLTFNSFDDGGWFVTEYCLTVEGEDASVKDYLRAVAEWIEKYQIG